MAFDKARLAASIRGRRAELNLNQSELASRVGVNITAISAWENPDGGYVPGAENLWNLCVALGCDLNELMGWDARRVRPADL